MRGVVLTGGIDALASHAGEPLIHHPLRALRDLGVDAAVLVAQPATAADLQCAIGDGEAFGMRLSYAAQTSTFDAAGIAVAAEFIGAHAFCVIFADCTLRMRRPAASIKGAHVFAGRGFDSRARVSLGANGDALAVTRGDDAAATHALADYYFYANAFAEHARELADANPEADLVDLNQMHLARGGLQVEMLDTDV